MGEWLKRVILSDQESLIVILPNFRSVFVESAQALHLFSLRQNCREKGANKKYFSRHNINQKFILKPQPGGETRPVIKTLTGENTHLLLRGLNKKIFEAVILEPLMQHINQLHIFDGRILPTELLVHDTLSQWHVVRLDHRDVVVAEVIRTTRRCCFVVIWGWRCCHLIGTFVWNSHFYRLLKQLM